MSDDTLKKYFEKHPKRDQPHGADRLQRILDKVKASEPRAPGGGLAAIIAASDKKKPKDEEPKGGGGHNGSGMSGPSPSISNDIEPEESEDSKEEVKPEESEGVEIEISPETEPVIVHVKRKRRYPKISM